MKRIFGILLASIAGIILLYLSRFWYFGFWSRDGLFGVKYLTPKGGLLARWLRGTDFAPYELLIWAVLVFLTLTYMQRGFGLLSKR